MIIFSLLFLALSSLAGCVGALVIGQLVPAVSILSLTLGFFAALFLSRAFKLELKAPPLTIPVLCLYAVILSGIYLHSIFFIYLKAGYYWIQNSFNLGDMSFHWNVIRSLAKGATFWPENPIYSDYRFRYPFGMDLINSFFESLGVPTVQHLPFVTLLSLLIVFCTLHIAGGPLLVFAVFFSCGLFNFWGNQIDWNHQKLQSSLDFKNIFLSILLTQRGFLYAMPSGVLLYRAIQKYFEGFWKPTTIEKIVLGIIWGGLGFFHLHSFFFVSLFIGIWILWQRDLKNWKVTIGVASLLGLPFVVNAMIPEVGMSSVIHWNWRGWNRPQEVGYISYWLLNLGPWLIAVVTALVVFFQQKKWNVFVPTLMAFLFFILFSHLILAPWNWDNIKLLVWCYIFALMGLTDFLWNHRGPWFKAVVCVALLPGMLVFVRSLPAFTHGIKWASEREMNKAEVALKGWDVNHTVLIDPSAYNHPVMLLGMKLFMGYPAQVWSHGYNQREREEAVKQFFAGFDGAVMSFSKGKVQLIYGGPLEKRRGAPVFLSEKLRKVGEALDHEVYIFER